MKDIEKFFTRHSDRRFHFSLIDPAGGSTKRNIELAKTAEKQKTDVVLIGGSDSIHSGTIFKTVRGVKSNVAVPVVQIIRDNSEISPYADGVIVPLVLNSSDVHYAIGIAINSIHLLKEMSIFCIPISYIIVGTGGTSAFVTKSIPVPETKPKIIKFMAEASEGMGLRSIYLEAGSGARSTVPKEFVKTARDSARKTQLIVGGGIATGRQASSILTAGADVIVTGSVLEKTGKIKEITDAIRNF